MPGAGSAVESFLSGALMLSKMPTCTRQSDLKDGAIRKIAVTFVLVGSLAWASTSWYVNGVSGSARSRRQV